MATHTLSGNLTDLVGQPLNPTGKPSAEAFLQPYRQSVSEGDDVRIGPRQLTLDSAGAFEQVEIPTGGYRVLCRYYDLAARRVVEWTSGWFNLEADADLQDKVDEAAFVPELRTLSIGTVITGTPVSVTLNPDGTIDFVLPEGGGGGGSSVTIDADGSLVVDGVTVELSTDPETASAIADVLAAHLDAADPHPQYLTVEEGDDTYDPLGAAADAQAAAATDATNKVATETTRATNAEGLLAPKASPTFTGTVAGVTKAHVGLGNVPNVDTTNASNITSGTLPTAVLPPLAINETFVVASQAAMLALTAQRGDMAIRTDTGKTMVLSTDSPTTLADWKEVLAAGQVQSVAGKTGVVTLAKADITDLGTIGTAAATNTGTGAANTILGNDARLTDSRTPSAHAASHASAGGDAVSLAASQITSGVLAIGRLATGTPDGTKFVSDAGTLLTPPGGGSSAPSWAQIKTGGAKYHGSPSVPGTNSISTVGAMLCHPFYVDRSCTADRLAIQITTAIASSTVRLGIYSDDGSGRPGTLLLDAGTVASTATGVQELTVSQALTAGTYWLAAAQQGGASAVSWKTETSGTLGANLKHGSSNFFLQFGGYNGYVHGSNTVVAGALPGTFTLTVGWEVSDRCPRISVRIT